MSVIAIAAVDENWGIGYKGELLERIPEDMKRFKELTLEHPVIMGKKTFESIPGYGLSHRDNIIITHGKKELYGGLHATLFDSLENILDNIILPNKDNLDIYIIGGASVYEQLLPYCDKIYLTHIYKQYENVDTYFPEVDGEEWEIESASDLKEYNGIYYSFTNYKRANT